MATENCKTPTDSDRLDWVLSFVNGDETSLADKRALLMAFALSDGFSGRAAIDAAMAKESAA